MTPDVEIPTFPTLTPEDARHAQNTKLLTKILFLVDSGTRDICTVVQDGSFKGILSYESYKSPLVDALRYHTDSELDGADQCKVWQNGDNRKLVFHASEIPKDHDKGLVFLWRSERPHGRLQPSNAYWSGGKRLPPITERLYQLHTYARGEPWEQEVTRIAKSMLRQGSNFFDCPYRSDRRLELTASQRARLIPG